MVESIRKLGRRLCLAGIPLLAVALSVPIPTPSLAAEQATTRVLDYRLSGPYQYENLTIFLLHGKDQLKGKAPLTLDAALKADKVIVRESDVPHLVTIENVSGDMVFVQTGDLIKGGKQDRLLAADVILPPKSGKVSVPAHSVEHARWQKRGKESEERFSEASHFVASQGLRLSGSPVGLHEPMRISQPQFNQIPKLGQFGNQFGGVSFGMFGGNALGHLNPTGALSVGGVPPSGVLGVSGFAQPGQLGQFGTKPQPAFQQPRPQASAAPVWREIAPVERPVGDVAALISYCRLMLEVSTIEAERTGQEAVWEDIDTLHAGLRKVVAAEVKSKQSESSLPLMLENEKVLAGAAKYVTKLRPSAAEDDVIGFVFAVNGRIKSADVYGSATLFKQTWPRLLQAAAIEALAESDAEKSSAPTAEDVAAFLRYASAGVPLPAYVSSSTRLVPHPRPHSLYFETTEPTRKDVWMHRSYLAPGR